MPKYNPKDAYMQTLLVKEGDQSFAPVVCATLGEAVIEVARWSAAEQAKARFRITGMDKGNEYSWRKFPSISRTWPKSIAHALAIAKHQYLRRMAGVHAVLWRAPPTDIRGSHSFPPANRTGRCGGEHKRFV
jgi:hypothetical protein